MGTPVRTSATSVTFMQTKTLIKAQDFKHQQVAKQLRLMIAELNTGDRLPAVAELGRHFAVAPATVEAAMGELRREGLIVRRQGSGTYVAPASGPSQVAEKPTSTQTKTGLIAVLGAGEEKNIGGGCYLDTLRALEAALNTLDYAPLLILDNDPAERGRRARERWSKGRIDGVIHIGSTDIEALVGLPAVIIGETPQAGRVSQVVVDSEAAGQRAGEYLWNLGHRRAAFLTMSGLDLFAAPRLRGLQQFWSAQNGARPGDVQAVTVLWNREMTEEQSREAKKIALQNLLRGDNPPTALFASQDETAIAALRVLEEMGVAVPEEVSVVGFDDAGMLASHARPGLTTLRIPSRTLGILAAQVLHEQILSPLLPPRTLRVPAELVVRESSGKAAGP